MKSIRSLFIAFELGGVYFTSDILAAADWLELLCRQSKIWSRGMMQYQQKDNLSGKRHPALGVMVKSYGCYAYGFRFNSYSNLADICFLCFFRLRLGITFRV